MYEIEKNVPLIKNYKTVYPFGDMEVGDSFPFPAEERNRASSAAWNYAVRHNVKFSIRKDKGNGGMRIWRVA